MPPRKRIPGPAEIAVSQAFVPDSTTPAVDEGLRAGVKDPLWFLARQWLTGEFEAENGGRPVQLDIEWTSVAIDRVVLGGSEKPLAVDAPLEFVVEKELADGTSPAWQADRLEFSFEVKAGLWTLRADEYEGHELDWFSFIADDATPALVGGTKSRKRFIPTPLNVAGMSHPRWWRFEERSLFLEDPNQPEPNLLSMLLTEFAYIDANNWFVVPIEQEAGSVRRVDSVVVVDGFGVGTKLGPIPVASDGTGWNVFTIEKRGGALLGGEFLFVPNVGSTVVNGDVLEEVTFIRDESANQVWAIERFYFDKTLKERVHRGDVVNPPVPIDRTIIAATLDSAVPAYRLKSHVAEHWIPYVPRRAQGSSLANSQMYLRRARSNENTSNTNPQYRGRLVTESWRVNEEEIPRTGVRVQRLWRFTRGSDGKGCFWIGRRKDVSPREASAGVDFDFIEK